MAREEGHYTIKRVGKLPKKGNSNLLYMITGNSVDTFYRWLPNNTYESISIVAQGNLADTDLQTASVQEATVIITDTNITQASAYNLLPAPGANKMIVPISIVSKIQITTAYTNIAGETLLIAWDANSVNEAAGIGFGDYEIVGQTVYVLPIQNVYSGNNINKSLDVVLSSYGGAGSLTGGVAEITIKVRYEVIDFS